MASWQDILDVDLVATARLLDAFLPCAVPGSVAVCLASIAGHLGTFEPAMDDLLDDPYDADLESRFRLLVGDEPEPDPGTTYRLAKRGVIRLCERAAVTWGANGGRVVSVSPGLIDTAMGRLELENNPIKHWMAENTPVGAGRSTPDAVLPGLTTDIADAVAFLCSPKAAFISGCDIRIDGALTATMNTQPATPPPTDER
jgi:NAD(P)-dependent dehydrogenase (short-subunit alcohol dehydrogenase family)